MARGLHQHQVMKFLRQFVSMKTMLPALVQSSHNKHLLLQPQHIILQLAQTVISTALALDQLMALVIFIQLVVRHRFYLIRLRQMQRQLSAGQHRAHQLLLVLQLHGLWAARLMPRLNQSNSIQMRLVPRQQVEPSPLDQGLQHKHSLVLTPVRIHTELLLPIRPVTLHYLYVQVI